MAKSKPELVDDLIRTAELVSDAMDDLQVPHIFITLKTTPPFGLYFCNGGTFLQSFFLALTVLVKTLEKQPELRPVLKTLWGVLDEIQIRWGERQEKPSSESDSEGMTELNEAIKELFDQVKGDEGSDENV